MPKTRYADLYGVTVLQKNIMKFVDKWVHEEKTPIPQTEIVKAMEGMGVKKPTTLNSINSLLQGGYLRRAVTISNKTYYVQLRRVN